MVVINRGTVFRPTLEILSFIRNIHGYNWYFNKFDYNDSIDTVASVNKNLTNDNSVSVSLRDNTLYIFSNCGSYTCNAGDNVYLVFSSLHDIGGESNYLWYHLSFRMKVLKLLTYFKYFVCLSEYGHEDNIQFGIKFESGNAYGVFYNRSSDSQDSLYLKSFGSSFGYAIFDVFMRIRKVGNEYLYSYYFYIDGALCGKYSYTTTNNYTISSVPIVKFEVKTPVGDWNSANVDWMAVVGKRPVVVPLPTPPVY